MRPTAIEIAAWRILLFTSLDYLPFLIAPYQLLSRLVPRFARIFFLGIAKAFWNHRHCRWFSLYKNPNRKFSLRFGKEEMSTEDKRRRLRRLVPSWSFLTRRRRPLLFRLAGKEGGEKGRWVTIWCVLPLNLGEARCFGLAFHTRLTVRASWYAPPDTGASDLQLVAFEYLQSIEGADQI